MSSGESLLAEHFLERKIYCEHYAEYNRHTPDKGKVDFDYFKKNGYDKNLPSPILFKNKEDSYCFAITQNRDIVNGYYVGIDWLDENEKAVYVQPKVNRNTDKQVDYLAMLFSALQHPEVFEHTKDLFEIKWDKPEININQQQDMLTPLLVLQYLQVVKNLVRKGLKKSYYKVEHNLRSRVKGKVLIAQNVKQNLVKSKTLNTYCAYDEFGFNGIENRILKKALVFVERYLPSFKGIGNKDVFTNTFNYIRPAFEQVLAEASLHECQYIKVNPFYKEYTQAIDLAKQILRRFGYNIQNTSTTQVTTPPFWIDMSKLFELYVLGLLKDKYGSVGVDFQFGDRANKLDFLLKTDDFTGVVDAKYKLKYNNGQIDHEDVRQVSGYARMHIVYEKLDMKPRPGMPHPLIDCLIIYPENKASHDKEYKLVISNDKEENKVKGYVGMYKIGVFLPAIEYHQHFKDVKF
jgi:5-methylcytosine-specific restriction enzyme subunit McrC